jgi:hypothetical protein
VGSEQFYELEIAARAELLVIGGNKKAPTTKAQAAMIGRGSDRPVESIWSTFLTIVEIGAMVTPCSK